MSCHRPRWDGAVHRGHFHGRGFSDRIHKLLIEPRRSEKKRIHEGIDLPLHLFGGPGAAGHPRAVEGKVALRSGDDDLAPAWQHLDAGVTHPAGAGADMYAAALLAD